MNIPIEFCGHKGTLTHISSRLAYPPWQSEDELLVHVEFHEPYPENIISTVVCIPALKYLTPEFLEVVKLKGEKQISEMLANTRQTREKQQRDIEHKNELQSFTEELEAKIEKEVTNG